MWTWPDRVDVDRRCLFKALKKINRGKGEGWRYPMIK